MKVWGRRVRITKENPHTYMQNAGANTSFELALSQQLMAGRQRENLPPELLLTCTATHVDPSPLTYRCVGSCVMDGQRLGGGNGY